MNEQRHFLFLLFALGRHEFEPVLQRTQPDCGTLLMRIHAGPG
jgi:hypothetical protein